ncbi:unnamed protein product [Phytophthora fragariaefolia]|uniref:Unnamed protein product n=1 Tax=Phytophthora fragariaefolia TaxID=1490495 RepID=A0A9W6WSW7_9STRA|nr:unnamed protein product [Phytophthora fragariaefolia]
MVKHKIRTSQLSCESETEEENSGPAAKCAKKVTVEYDPSVSHQLSRRRTKTWEARQKMINSHKPVENIKPGFPVKVFETWKEYDEMF